MKKIVARDAGAKGLGVYAGKNIRKGETVHVLRGKQMSVDAIGKICDSGKLRNDDPLQVGDTEYIRLTGISNLFNHSCDPNVAIQSKRKLVALKNISKDDEITYDYSAVVGSDEEWETPWHMKCACKAKICRKRIGNWETLPPARLTFYKKMHALPDFIRTQIKKKK